MARPGHRDVAKWREVGQTLGSPSPLMVTGLKHGLKGFSPPGLRAPGVLPAQNSAGKTAWTASGLPWTTRSGQGQVPRPKDAPSEMPPWNPG